MKLNILFALLLGLTLASCNSDKQEEPHPLCTPGSDPNATCPLQG